MSHKLYYNYDKRRNKKMLRQLLDAIDADDYETIKKILDTIERSVNNE
jgi:tetrahydromethanopterin S-methyltransferase subunit G